ncbi:MAG TPA: flagellar biosynthesis protein FlhF [Chthonomonadales bacterium]|nr:flagellar biosynthesis protein FlhF [Chthonomonadales bacterium]
MNVREYEAPTLRDGLLQVREDLGPDAVILETQKLRRGGVMGLGARDAVRIVAALEVPMAPRSEPPVRRPLTDATTAIAPSGSPEAPPSVRAASPMRAGAPRPEHPSGAPTRPQITPSTEASVARPHPRLDRAYERAAQSEGPRAPTCSGAPLAHAVARDRVAAVRNEEGGPAVARLEREIRELRDSVATVRGMVLSPTGPGGSGSSGKATAFAARGDDYDRLVGADVQPQLARELIDGMPDLGAWEDRARRHLAEQVLSDAMAARVSASGPIAVERDAAHVVALVGPVGVGKTTTIAKLAAHYALAEGRRVALLTMDTYRIAAVDQLRTYSQIIGIPLTVVSNPAEARQALAQLAGKDLVLIDTAGRSQKHAMQMAELKALVDATGCETHLALSASTKYADMMDQVARFSHARVDRLLFTKLDETTTYGTIFSVAAAAGLPVSYLTTGQRVPEDIEDATPPKLASLVLNQQVR